MIHELNKSMADPRPSIEVREIARWLYRKQSKRLASGGTTGGVLDDAGGAGGGQRGITAHADGGQGPGPSSRGSMKGGPFESWAVSSGFPLRQSGMLSAVGVFHEPNGDSHP